MKQSREVEVVYERNGKEMKKTSKKNNGVAAVLDDFLWNRLHTFTPDIVTGM